MFNSSNFEHRFLQNLSRIIGVDGILSWLSFYWEMTARGGDSHMKWTGMLVVSLRGVNFGFWSRLGCPGKNVIIFSRQGLVFGCTRRNNKKERILIRYSYSFRGLHNVRPHPDWSLLGVKFKISDEHPRPFHMGVPPRGWPFTLMLQALKC